jgi:hypothetical protein
LRTTGEILELEVLGIGILGGLVEAVEQQLGGVRSVLGRTDSSADCRSTSAAGTCSAVPAEVLSRDQSVTEPGRATRR